MKRYLKFSICFALVMPLISFSAEPSPTPSVSPSAAPSPQASPGETKNKPVAKGAPSKEIQFDDSVVEGMNQVSKDSLETVSKRDATARAHLYTKRTSFKEEIQQVGREIGELP